MDGLKISELAERAGVNVSTVRYYERVGLVPDPARSHSGYRLYDTSHQTRLLFITRARRLGMTVEQVAELLGIWDGANCATTRAGVVRMLELSGVVWVRAQPCRRAPDPVPSYEPRGCLAGGSGQAFPRCQRSPDACCRVIDDAPKENCA